jgi:glycosyltransferase 2 family protein
VTRTWLRRCARWILGLGVPLTLLAVASRQADPRAGLRLLAAAFPVCLLGLLPYGVVLFVDSIGWRLLFAPWTRRRVPLGTAFSSRMAGEAVAQTLPSAGLAGEAASAWLLSKRTAVPLGEVIGSLAARRVLLAPGHAAMLAVAALLGAARPEVPAGLVATLAAASLGLALAATAGARLLVRGQPFARVHLAIRRAPWAGLRAWAGGSSVRLRDADREAGRLLAGSWRPRAAASLLFALVFLAESLETFLLLRLLGAPLTFGQAVAVEPLVSLLRALAFFVPAGLGVQDLGYVALLRVVGAPEAAAAGAAFVLLKRLKELVWVGAGWSLLLAADGRAGEVRREREREAPDPVRLRLDQPDDADAPGRARAARA